MDRKSGLYLSITLAVGAAGALLWVWWGPPERGPPSAEVRIRPIPMSGGAETAEAEFSGLAWWRDTLVLLPQYPERFDNNVFALAREEIEGFLDGSSAGPLEVRRVPLVAPILETHTYDGFEAIAFDGDRVYVSIETQRGDTGIVGRLLSGRVEGDLDRIVIDAEPSATLEAQNGLDNTGYEAIVLAGAQILAIYETNGAVNADPRALVFDRDLRPRGAMPMMSLQYRVTDASDVDEEGRFWVANYHWPGAPWEIGQCELTDRYGQGESHNRCATVERLVELEVHGDRIVPTDRAPVQLELVDDTHSRNWEGLVRLGDRGFLMVTDEYPETILGFVPRQ